MKQVKLMLKTKFFTDINFNIELNLKYHTVHWVSGQNQCYKWRICLIYGRFGRNSQTQVLKQTKRNKYDFCALDMMFEFCGENAAENWPVGFYMDCLLRLPAETKVIRQSSNRSNLLYHVLDKKSDGKVALVELVKKEYPEQCGIVYCVERGDTVDVAYSLLLCLLPCWYGCRKLKIRSSPCHVCHSRIWNGYWQAKC